MVASFSDYAQDPILTDRRFWITVFMASAILPLSFLRKLDSLKYTSLVALIAVIYLCTIVLYYFFSISNPVPPPVIEYATFSSDFFSRLPVFVFAFTCHQNVSDLRLILQHPCLIHIVRSFLYTMSSRITANVKSIQSLHTRLEQHALFMKRLVFWDT